ncbi:MAG: Stf0 family sulfotransferase [Pseudomonadota bacterium]
MNLYESQFDRKHDVARVGDPVTTVLIASTPRCGSHMIGHAMAATGRLGVPFEYANRANMVEWMRRLGTDTPRATLDAIMQRRTSPNRVFGIKAHFEQIAVFGSIDAFLAALPGLRVVHLRRADILRQAVSYAFAKQTGVWIAGQEATRPKAEFDYGLIERCLTDIAIQNAQWSSAFRDRKLDVLEITYETAVLDVAVAVDRIAAFCGVLDPGQTLNAPVSTSKQSNRSRTEDWIERFVEQSQRRPALLARIGGAARRAIAMSGGA